MKAPSRGRPRGQGGQPWSVGYIERHPYEKEGGYCSKHPKTRSVAWSPETGGQCAKCLGFDPDKVGDYEKIVAKAEKALKKLRKEE